MWAMKLLSDLKTTIKSGLYTFKEVFLTQLQQPGAVAGDHASDILTQNVLDPFI